MGTVSKKQKTSNTDVVDLTPEEVLHLAKPKEGFTEQVEPLVELYVANHGAMPGFDPEGVRTEIAAYDALEPTIDELRAKLAVALKTRALHASNAWRGGLRIYKWGLLMSENSPTIKRGISRFEHFMKQGPRKKPAPVASDEAVPTNGTKSSS